MDMASTEMVKQPEQFDIPLHILKEITNGFSNNIIIGSRGYAKIYKGFYKGEEIAVKLLNDDMPGSGDKEFENECIELMKINHPNVVRFVGYCCETYSKQVDLEGIRRFCKFTSRVICFEYLKGGSLDKYLKEHREHDWQTRYKIIKGICEGLKFLHSGCGFGSPILHLDLKPDNILLDKNMVPKIADFGLARPLRCNKYTYTDDIRGTRGYMAPEYWSNREISPKNDVFSLGVIILQIMAGYSNYSEFHETDDAKKFTELVISNWTKQINASASPYPLEEADQVKACIEIARKCKEMSKNNRPSVAKVVDILNATEERIRVKRRMNDPRFVICEDLRALAANSRGTFHAIPVPKYPKSSTDFSQQLDTILQSTATSQNSGNNDDDVVIVYAFDCTTETAAWKKMDDVYWVVHAKLTHRVDSIGYIFAMSESNTFRSDMKLLDKAEETTGYTQSSNWRKADCTKNMAYGVSAANELIRGDGGGGAGVVLLFSDGSAYKGDYFDGARGYDSQVPVHTFTLFPEA